MMECPRPRSHEVGRHFRRILVSGQDGRQGGLLVSLDIVGIQGQDMPAAFAIMLQ